MSAETRIGRNDEGQSHIHGQSATIPCHLFISPERVNVKFVVFLILNTKILRHELVYVKGSRKGFLLLVFHLSFGIGRNEGGRATLRGSNKPEVLHRIHLQLIGSKTPPA